MPLNQRWNWDKRQKPWLNTQLSELWGRQPGDRYLSFYETSELLKKICRNWGFFGSWLKKKYWYLTCWPFEESTGNSLLKKEKKKQKTSYNVNKTFWFVCFTHLDLYTLVFFSKQEQSYALKIKDKMQPLRIISQMMLGGKKPCSYWKKVTLGSGES